MHPHDCYSALEEQMKNSINFYIRQWIYGNVFAGMLYGAIVLITIAYLRILTTLFRGKKSLSTQQWILSMYIVPDCVRGMRLENVCFMLTAWTMWRFFIIYHDLKRTKWSVFVFYSLAFIGTGAYTAFIMSSSMGFDPEHPTDLHNRVVLFLVLFEAVILLQNIMLTTLIVGRLLLFRCRIQSIASMVVLSPMILIYRVMQGKMCNSQTIAQITEIRFKND
ncbi:hypothetical protein BDQ17DRAFT_1385114, partial [Cyathus striatus]